MACPPGHAIFIACVGVLEVSEASQREGTPVLPRVCARPLGTWVRLSQAGLRFWLPASGRVAPRPWPCGSRQVRLHLAKEPLRLSRCFPDFLSSHSSDSVITMCLTVTFEFNLVGVFFEFLDDLYQTWGNSGHCLLSCSLKPSCLWDSRGAHAGTLVGGPQV